MTEDREPLSLAPKEDVQAELNERLGELVSLLEVSKSLDASLDLKATLDHILLTAMGKMLVTKGMILLRKGGGQFEIETSKGLREELLGSLTLAVERAPSTWLLLDQEGADQMAWASTLKSAGMALVLPMQTGDEVLGLVCFGSRPAGTKYRPADIDYLTSLANIASTTIHSNLVVEQLRTVNRRLDRKIQELNTLFDIGKELNSTMDPRAILQLLTYALMGQMAVHRCLILVFRDHRIEYSISQGMKNQALDLIDEHLIKRLALISEPFSTDGRRGLEMLPDAGLRVIVPMRHQGATRGIIGLGQRAIGESYSEGELEFISTLANQAMIAIENARLFKEELEKKRLEEELSIASRIQQRLLPKSIPEFQGIEVTGLNIPSKQVGGDYYDFVVIDADHTAVAIADVSGKGAPASLLMANLQASLRTLVGENKPLGEVMGKMNNLIVQNTDIDKFITAVCGILDSGERSFTYSNAGHNPPLLVRADGSTEYLDKGGLVLGMMSNMPYEQGTVRLQAQDAIIMYTDGVTEAINGDEEEFGESRLIETVRRNAELDAGGLAQEIVRQVKAFSSSDQQQDDITLVIIRAK